VKNKRDGSFYVPVAAIDGLFRVVEMMNWSNLKARGVGQRPWFAPSFEKLFCTS